MNFRRDPDFGTNSEYTLDPEALFGREFSDFTAIARIMRGLVEELNPFAYRPGSDVGWLWVKTMESSRVASAMARLQAAQAGSLRPLALRRGQHAVTEHRRHIPPSRNGN